MSKAMTRTTRPGRLARVATGLMATGLAVALAGTALCAPNPAAGKPLYTKYCLSCHTPDGKAKVKGSPDLSSKAVQSKMTDAKMTAAILNGTPHMPGYKKQMTAAQAADLVAYVRTLAK
jgi:mono/diheme cytochrome c family protein